MRMLLKVQIPTENGNAAIKDGSLAETLGSALEALNAEAAYFIAEDGVRTGLIFFEMADSSDIPPSVEPFLMGLEAKVSLHPTMNPDEMRAGVGKVIAAQ